MANLSVLDRVLNYKAATALWSHSPSNRMLAATFLRLGDQLEAQWESNDIQRRLCTLAVETNDLLADMRASLGEISDLLSQSLAIQTEHLMLDKRESILKEALFRWSEVLMNGDGLSDPHWILIACRTFFEFMESWGFKTQDLREATEKRALLDLLKRAKELVKNTPQPVIAEVNVFQALYSECKDLIASAPSPLTAPVSRSLKLEVADFLRDMFPLDAFPLGLNSVDGMPYMVALTSAWFAQTEARSMQEAAIEKAAVAGEKAIVGIYGYSGVRRTRLAVFTERAWYEIFNKGSEWSQFSRNEYASGSELGFFDRFDRDFDFPRLDVGRLIAAAKTLPQKLPALLIRVEQEATDARRGWEQQAAEEKEIYENRVSFAVSQVSQYLDLHPYVTEFYPRMECRSVEADDAATTAGCAVLLESIGSSKIDVIRVVRSVTGMDLKTAKQLIESCPVVIQEGISMEDATQIVTALRNANARASIA